MQLSRKDDIFYRLYSEVLCWIGCCHNFFAKMLKWVAHFTWNRVETVGVSVQVFDFQLTQGQEQLVSY